MMMFLSLALLIAFLRRPSSMDKSILVIRFLPEICLTISDYIARIAALATAAATNEREMVVGA
jgi:hypothetical protein